MAVVAVNYIDVVPIALAVSIRLGCGQKSLFEATIVVVIALFNFVVDIVVVMNEQNKLKFRNYISEKDD